MDWNKVEIDNIGLSTRASNTLHRVGVHTVEAFLDMPSESFLGISRIGEKTAREMQEKQKQILNGAFEMNQPLENQPISNPDNEKWMVDLDMIDMSNRARNALRRQGIHTVSAFLKMAPEQFLSISQIGEKTSEELLDLQQKLLNGEQDLLSDEVSAHTLSEDCSSWLHRKEEKERLLQYLKEHDRPLKELTDLGARTYNSLMRGGKSFLSKIISSSETEIQNLKRMGSTSVSELEYSLVLFLEKNKKEILEWDRNHPVEANEQEKTSPVDETQLVIRFSAYTEKVKDFFRKNDTPISSLDLPERAVNCLTNFGYHNLSDIILLKKQEFGIIRGMGTVTLQAITSLIDRYYEKYRDQLEAYIGGNNDALYSDGFLETQILALFPGDSFEGIAPREIRNRLDLPEDFNEERIRKALGRLISQKKLEYVDYRCYLVHMKVMDAVEACPKLSDRSRDMIRKKLDNVTLEELGKEYELTRERVRQIIGKSMDQVKAWYLGTSGISTFDEDYYAHFYHTYDFDKATGQKWFGLDLATECYLDILPGKRKRRALTEALEDEVLGYGLRMKVQNYLNRNKLYLDDSWIDKDRRSLEDYIIRKYCTEDVTFDQFVEIYTDFLNREGIDDPELSLTEEQIRTRKNRLRECPIVLWKQNERMRFYDIQSQDYGELLDTLSLDSYENVELSTLHFMELYPEVMKKYDIRDQYELHNLLRKIIPEGSYNDLSFSKMPGIRFGTFDRDGALFDLIVENSPISSDKLCDLIHQEYGYEKGVTLGTYLAPFAEYYHQGVYSVDQKEMSADHMAALKSELRDDFYFMDEIRRIYAGILPDGDPEEINPYNLKKLDFTVLSGYVLSNRYPSLDAYFRELLTKEEVTDFAKYRRRFGYVVSFSQTLVNLKREKEVIEYERNQLISIRRLERLGVTKEDLNRFCDDVYAFADDRSFTVRSIRKDGFRSGLFDLGFSDQFYHDILTVDGRFTYSSFYGTTVLNKAKKEMTLHIFLKEVIGENDGIDVYDLISELEHQYGCTVPDRVNLIYGAKRAGCYHDGIMDRLYISKDSFYQDVYTEEP